MTAPEIPLDAQIACLQRELRLRIRTYPRLVAAAKMTQGVAKHEIESLSAAVATLQAIEKRGVSE